MLSAYVLIQFGSLDSADAMARVHKDLRGVKGVKTVHILAGPTDAIAYVEAADQNALMQAIGGIRMTRGVASTDTRIVFPI